MNKTFKNALSVMTILISVTVFSLAFVPSGLKFVFASSPGDRIIRFYPVFSSMAFGYANFLPAFSVILFFIASILHVISSFEKIKGRKGLFVASALLYCFAAVLLIMHLSVFGLEYITPVLIALMCLESIGLAIVTFEAFYVFRPKRSA